MEKQGVAGVHLDVDQRQALEDFLDPSGRRRPGRRSARDRSGPADASPRSPAGSRSPVAGSTAMKTLSRRGEHAVLVPVAVILVPGPGAAHLGVLHDHLRVVVVHLAAEDLLEASTMRRQRANMP